MTVVLVHGNPETPEVWDLLMDRLVDDGAGQPVRLAPPGFGAPVPIDFSCTPAAYRDWLIEELKPSRARSISSGTTGAPCTWLPLT
jgi:pimeloyl-ACP methyl ester carboxylesterase